MTSNSAEEIIERFGGIRPMAGKLGIPVTTVQGWKKRNFIPPARLGEIQQAAEQNNIDISDLIDGLQNQTEPVTANARPESARPQSPPRATQPALSKEEFDAFLERKIAERMAGIEKKTVTKGAVINAALLVLTLVAGVALLWPYKKMPEENQQALQSIENKIGTLQGDLAEIKEEQSFIDELKQDAAKVQQGVQGAITQAQEISGDLSAGTLEERIAKLEGHIGNNAASSMMSDLLTRYQSMMGSAQGDAMLGGVVQQLNAMLPESGQNKEEMDVALQTATEAVPDHRRKVCCHVPKTRGTVSCQAGTKPLSDPTAVRPRWLRR
ncbi:MAG: carph-isopro domain-containing protein, partial [Alphaproteobacteria bacterium]